MKVAVIDCGTNSVRLLIASWQDGVLVSHDRRLELVRLGQDVDATGRFADEALQRLFATCGRFRQVIDKFDCQKVRFVATSAARDVSNREVFESGVEQILGVRPEVISGLEEAQASCAGALSQIPVTAEPVLITDCGGGSTELVLARADATISVQASLNMGSVRIRERFLHDDPPTRAEIVQATNFIDEMLDDCQVDVRDAQQWVGVAGTITSMSAINLGLTSYDAARVHGSDLLPAEISAITESLLVTPVAKIIEQGLLKPRRAEIICAGALIIDRIANRVRKTLTVSESDLMDGIALALLSEASSL